MFIETVIPPLRKIRFQIVSVEGRKGISAYGVLIEIS